MILAYCHESLSLTYGRPEDSCTKLADTYFGRRSASLIKEFWTLCILLMTDSETVMIETIPYSNIGLTHCLKICKMVVGLGPHFLLTKYPLTVKFFVAAFKMFCENSKFKMFCESHPIVKGDT